MDNLINDESHKIQFPSNNLGINAKLNIISLGKKLNEIFLFKMCKIGMWNLQKLKW